jgi:hypothetical protein
MVAGIAAVGEAGIAVEVAEGAEVIRRVAEVAEEVVVAIPAAVVVAIRAVAVVTVEVQLGVVTARNPISREIRGRNGHPLRM